MTTPGEEAARAALRESADQNRAEVHRAGETIRVLTAGIRAEVRDGIADAMTDENAERFWRKGFEIAQQEAANRAGLLVLGGIKRALGVAAVVLAVYMLAGAPAARAIWAALTKG